MAAKPAQRAAKAGGAPLRLVSAAGGMVATGDGTNDDDPRGDVVIEAGRIDYVVDDAEANMLRLGVPLYVRGDMLTLLADGESRRRRGYADALPALVPATTSMLLEAMESTTRFLGRTRDGMLRIVSCPREAPSVYLSRVGRWQVPAVRGIALVPLLRADGALQYDGHDPDSGMVVCAGPDWPVSDRPVTEGDARGALARVCELIEGFPFVSDADRAVTVAAFLSAVLRPSLPTVPGFAWSASVRGSGKTKLADVCAVLATGAPAAPLSWPAQSEEQEKRLGAALLCGDPVIAIDNVESNLRGDCLNILLTSRTMAIRVLGRSVQPRVPVSALLTVTGNNLVISGDLTRRILVAHLDPGCERPELRRFDFDPVTRARAHRRELVAALLMIARWGQTMRGGSPPLGSFEEWSRRVRDPLMALGMADACACLDVLHREDPEREAAREVLQEWLNAFGFEPATSADAVRKATNGSGSSALRDALDPVCGGPGGLNTKRLGRYLLRYRDRVIDGMVMRREDDRANNSARWRVESVDKAGDIPGFDDDGPGRRAPTADDYRAATDGE